LPTIFDFFVGCFLTWLLFHLTKHTNMIDLLGSRQHWMSIERKRSKTVLQMKGPKWPHSSLWVEKFFWLLVLFPF